MVEWASLASIHTLIKNTSFKSFNQTKTAPIAGMSRNVKQIKRKGVELTVRSIFGV